MEDPVAPFLADDDWVQNLTVYLFNRTNQTIVQGVLNFSFPETLDYAAHRGPVFQLQLGRIPESVAFDKGRPIPQGGLATARIQAGPDTGHPPGQLYRWPQRRDRAHQTAG